ncbi:MAG: glycosyltransferase family 2 protein [Clostridia bacterium]|nr:glycosyltransferase family 2 protein [Clostridia bacterium]
MKEFKNHTFIICAYKESPYLEECIKSVLSQKVKSNVIITTSTPNDYIKGLAIKYNLEMYINNGEKGIGQDWNFGVSKANTDYITIAHQDDIYKPEYLESIVSYIKKGKDFIIAFTDYREIKNNIEIELTRNLKIKKILLFPIIIFKKSKFIRRRVLSLGSSICCPSVTINKKNTGENPYTTQMKCDLDWDTWDKLSKYKGRFIYINKELMAHRIHEESETSNLIENNTRLEEDFTMLQRYWPKPIAKLIMKFYSKAIETNKM